MELIIITKQCCKASKISLGKSWLAAALLAGVVVLIAVFYAGSWYGLEYSSNSIALKYQQIKAARQEEQKMQRLLVEKTTREAQENLDALAARLSKLQGHIMRLDALGARLAAMANIDEIDFGMTAAPGMGGPRPADMNKSLDIPDFVKQLERLGQEIEDRGDKLAAMESMLMNSNLQDKTLPDSKPVHGGWLSSLFGWRTDPISGKREFHEGVDFASKSNTLVSAVAAGIVTWSGRRGGFGNMVEISHGNGYVTRYAHNRQNLVAVGDKVEKGQAIAVIGSTGRSTGTHVHLEVLYNGEHVDPRKYISVN